MKVVCFSEIQWQYLTTRKQQVIRRFPDDWEILFFSSVVGGKANNFLPKREGRILHVCIPVLKNFPQPFVQKLFAFPPIRFLWNMMLWIWVNSVMLFTGFSGGDRVFYVSNIYYAAVLPFLSRSVMLYDCNDDPLAFPNTPSWAAGYFRKLGGDADIVVAASTGLVDRLQDAGVRHVNKIVNGVDNEAFEKAAAEGPPAELTGMAKPVIGYVGAIAQWFDFDLVERIAGEFPGGSIALVGPVFAGLDRRLSDLVERCGNVRHFGPQPYGKLGSYVAGMDVCLIPLLKTPLRRVASRPNKLYEYAAIGKPIVTMKYSDDMDPLADMIYLSETADEFVSNCHAAVERGADSEKLKAFAKDNSWANTARGLVSLICSYRDEEEM